MTAMTVILVYLATAFVLARAGDAAMRWFAHEPRRPLRPTPTDN